jgi:predicted RNA-binding Zn-ribbon protein involved in translation (DUF1610 family)
MDVNDHRDDLLGRLILPVREGVGFNPGGVSRWMRRRHRWGVAFAAGSCFAGIACIMVGLVLSSRGGPMLQTIIIGASLPFLGGLGSVVVLVGSRRRERAASEAASGQACPSCLYDLSAERVERCSECGQRVIYEALPVLWAGASWRRAWSGRVDGATGFSASGLSVFEARARRWGLVLSLLIPLVFFVPWQAVFHGASGLTLGARVGWGALATLVAALAVLVPVFVLLIRKKKHLERALRATGGLSCPACLADLSGGAVGACPECGQRVEYATLQNSWRVRMRVLGIGSRGSES